MELNHADKGVALLRIVIGLWFIKAGMAHLTMAPEVFKGAVPPQDWATPHWQGEMGRLLGVYSEHHPLAWYREFLDTTLSPHSTVFAGVASMVELVVGVSLAVGFFTLVGALAGMGYAGLFGLMQLHTGLGPQGLYLILFCAMLVFIFTRAGRVWGLDQWLARLWHGSPLW